MLPWKQVAVLFICLLLVESNAVTTHGSGTGNTYYKDILMKGAKPLTPDAYLCASYEVEEDEAYIVAFEAEAFADTAHHILIYGCESGPASRHDYWSCPPMCRSGESQIMFAWAKNAPPTHLPPGVGLRIGRKTSIRTIVVQIHYAKAFKVTDKPDTSGIRLHLSKEKQKYVAGVFLLLSYNFAIPPNQAKYHVDISCRYNEHFIMHPFAYRTHAHGWGRVITGYQYNWTGYHLIGKGNPQWPQAFYPSNTSIVIKPGDYLAARCTYNSVGTNRTVEIGATGNDEMCNFYIMFYTDSSVQVPTGQCGGVESQALVKHLPKGSDVTLPPNPLLEAAAHGHHHHHHAMPSSSSSSVSSSSSTHVTGNLPGGANVSLSGHLEYQSNWPRDSLKIGQVGGVATDLRGNVYVFHRGKRVWDMKSFYKNNTFRAKNQAIQEDTVIILSPDGHLLHKFGKNQHFMPQGIEVDDSGNIWLTDVALHQVFRIPAGGTQPNLIVGKRFVSGTDSNHFCKPSDVAVLKSGEFFVSDGFCNSRIMKFSPEGHFIKQWGERSPPERVQAGPGQFFIPHSLAVAPDLGLLCVADRNNGRVQCFDLEGHFRFSIKHPQFGPTLYAVDYCPEHGGLLFAVNGAEGRHVKGFTFSLSNQKLLETWNMPPPLSLISPQDVAVDARGRAVYVAERNLPAVRKFVRNFTNTTNTTTNLTSATTAGTHSTPSTATSSGYSSSSTAASTTPLTTTTTTTTTTPGTTPGPTATTTTTSTVPLSSPSTTTVQSSKTDKSQPEGERHTKHGSGGGKSGPSVKKMETEAVGVSPYLLVGPLVAVPLCMLMLWVIIRVQNKQGFCRCCRPRGVSLSDWVKNSRKGFDPLLQPPSEDSDSENDMFLKPNASNGSKVQQD